MDYELLVRQIEPFEIVGERAATFAYFRTLGVPDSYLRFLETTNGGYLQSIGSWEALVNGVDIYLRGFRGICSIDDYHDILAVSRRIQIANGHSELRYLVISFSDVGSLIAYDMEKLKTSSDCEKHGLVEVYIEVDPIISTITDLRCGFVTLVEQIHMIPQRGWENEPEDFEAVRLSRIEHFHHVISDPKAMHERWSLPKYALQFSTEEAVLALIDNYSFEYGEPDLMFAINRNVAAARALVRRGVKLPSLDELIRRANENSLGEFQLICALSLYPTNEVHHKLDALGLLSVRKGFWSAMDQFLERELTSRRSEEPRDDHGEQTPI